MPSQREVIRYHSDFQTCDVFLPTGHVETLLRLIFFGRIHCDWLEFALHHCTYNPEWHTWAVARPPLPRELPTLAEQPFSRHRGRPSTFDGRPQDGFLILPKLPGARDRRSDLGHVLLDLCQRRLGRGHLRHETLYALFEHPHVERPFFLLCSGLDAHTEAGRRVPVGVQDQQGRDGCVELVGDRLPSGAQIGHRWRDERNHQRHRCGDDCRA